MIIQEAQWGKNEGDANQGICLLGVSKQFFNLRRKS